MRGIFGFLLLAVPVLAQAPLDPQLLATAQGLMKDLRSETLPNGLQVFLLPIPGSPVVTTMTAYRVGSCDEAKDQTGLSHYLEHLLFKGTDKLMPGDIDRMTQRAGGRNNAFTTEDMTVYHFDFAADRWTTALDIEAERMRKTRIDDKHEFQQEKGAVIAELKKYEDEPWDLESKALLPLLFGSGPYGHPVIGEEEHVRAATAETITRYYDRWYHPNNAAIVVVGGFDPAEAMNKITALFGPIPKGELPERVTAGKMETRTRQARKEFASKFDIPRVIIGFNGVEIGHPDDFAFDVLSEVLTGGKTSRMHQSLVLKEQLASTVTSANNAGRHPGWFEIQMEVLPGKDRRKAEEALFAVLKRMAEEPISLEELARARRSITASFIFSRESTHSMAELIARNWALKDIEYSTKYLERMLAVTPADVQRVAKDYLARESAAVVWSLPPDEAEGGNREKNNQPPRRVRYRNPAGGGGQGVKLSDATSVVLPNGLKLIMLENHRLPIVVAHVSIGHVRLREPAKFAGLAYLLGDMLDEGTARHSGDEIANLIENVGGALSLSGTGGSIKVLTPDTDLGLGLLFECLMYPSFPKDRFQAVREDLLGEIAADEAIPQRKAIRLFQRIIYGDHPYARPVRGNDITVLRLKIKDLKTFHSAVFVPNNATVVVVGDFDSVKMREKIAALTAEWKRAELPKLAVTAPPVIDGSQEQILSEPTAAQTHVFLGHLGIRRDHPDYYKLEVMDNVLGVSTGFTDRLSSTLRDRQGLAYTVRAAITDDPGEEPGTFMGYIGTFPDKYIWVRDGFLKEIRKLREEPPTIDEVEGAKSFLLGSLAFQIETNSQIAAELLMIERHKLGFDYLEKYRKAISAVTPADVLAMAKKHLHPDKIIIVAAGPIDAEGRPLPAKKKDDAP